MAQVTITVKGGFWGDLGGTFTGLADNHSAKKQVAQHFGKRSMHRLRELMETLDGVVDGSAALKQRREITAPSDASPANTGGVMANALVDIVDRVTVTADETEINGDLLTHGGINSSFPANGDGNSRGWAA